MEKIDRGSVNWGMGIGLQGDQGDQLNVGGRGNFNIKMEKVFWTIIRNNDSHTRERVVYFSLCVLASECEMQIQ